MRRIAITWGLPTLLIAAFVMVTVMQGPEATAAGCPPGEVSQVDAVGNTICVVVSLPGHGGTETGGGHTTTTSTGTATCLHNGEEIACVTDLGVWYSAHQCYAQIANPQPEAISVVWGGNSPDDGDMWVCSTYDGPGTI